MVMYSTRNGKLKDYERLDNSKNGNPRYKVKIELYGDSEERVFITTSDSMCSYIIPNFKIGSDVRVRFHWGSSGTKYLDKLEAV